MKLIAIVGACIVAGVALLASASTASVPSWGRFRPSLVSPLSGAAAAGASAPASLLAGEAAVLMRRGISPDHASQAIDVQGKVTKTDVVGQLEAAMGGAYAGAWFDAAAARLRVGATSPASRRVAGDVIARAGLASHANVTPVRSTWAQLLAAQARWNHMLATLFASAEVQTALSAQRNALVVTLSSSVPPPQRAALKRAASAATVNVSVGVVPTSLRITPEGGPTKCNKFVAGEAYCSKPITSGVTIIEPLAPTEPCTAGPLAISEAEPFDTYVLTAGHCVLKESEPWDAFDQEGEQHEFGRSQEHVYGEAGDYGDILVGKESYWVEAGNEPVFAVTAEWLLPEEEESHRVIREGKNVEGLVNCHEGQTTGESCGKIKNTGVTVTYVGGVKVGGLVEDEEAVSAPGDSGGPWLFIESNKEALMLGIHSGKNSLTGQTVYEPLHTALEGLKLELLTQNNENRAKDKEEKERKGLLLVPKTGTYPYHLVGVGGKFLLETVGGSKVESGQVDFLALISSATLLNASLKFLKTKSSSTACTNTAESETVLTSMSGHFGLADPGRVPAMLLLVPSGFEFTCGGLVKIKIKGTVIGKITKPALKASSEELLVSFKQTKGKQELTAFLPGTELLTNRFEEASVSGGAFEQAGEEGEVHLLALPGQGTFLLLSP